MDRLPCELFRHILQYIDQVSDLLRMSYVCSHWRFAIISDEYFLNPWFLRLLKNSRKSFSCGCACYDDKCRPPDELNLDQSLFPVSLRPGYGNFMAWLLNLDQSLFPSNFRSSDCDFLPWIVSRSSSDYKQLYEYVYSLSFYDSSHSFSFWLYLPPRCELNIQVGNVNVGGSNIRLCSDKKYHSDNGESFSVTNRWIHIVLGKIDSESNYRIRIDGQCIAKLKQCRISLSQLQQHYSLFNILLCRKFNNHLLEISNQARIADLNAFTRCLTLAEIRAIHQQQVPINQVKVGTYIKQQLTTAQISNVIAKLNISHKNSICSYFLRFLLVLIHKFL